MAHSVTDRGYEPDVAIPPGATLRESIDAVGMTQAELARRMGRPLKTVNEIVKGRTAITPETATQLERVLGAPARFWLRLEMDFQATRARLREQESITAQASLVGEFPYADMAKLGWVEKVRDKTARVIQLCSFFGVARLEQVRVIEEAAFRKSRKRKASPYALSAWLRRGEVEAQQMDTATFDRKGFLQVLSTARGLTRAPLSEATRELKRICATHGVALAYVPHLKGTYVNGATRWLGDKALIQLSLRYRYEDIFWFTFFHECGHILRHGKKERFIDLPGDPCSPAEDEADRFAQDALIPPRAYHSFRDAGPYSMATVRRFAQDIQVCPAIVVGRLQHDGLLQPSHLNGLRRRLAWANGPR